MYAWLYVSTPRDDSCHTQGLGCKNQSLRVVGAAACCSGRELFLHVSCLWCVIVWAGWWVYNALMHDRIYAYTNPSTHPPIHTHTHTHKWYRWTCTRSRRVRDSACSPPEGFLSSVVHGSPPPPPTCPSLPSRGM